MISGRGSAVGLVCWLFVVAWTLHTIDHLRRGLEASGSAVTASGTVVAMAVTAALTLVAVGHPIAPTVVVVAFGGTAIGVSASHLLPEWGALSDPILDGATDGWTTAAVLGEIVAAVLVVGVFVPIVRAGGYRLRTPGWR